MSLEGGEGKGGTAVWRLTPGGFIVIPNVLIDAAGSIIVPSTEDKQDDTITELQVARTLDPNNSYTTNLINGEVFTGAWTPNLNSTTVMVYVITDKDSATDGLEIQESTDGANPSHIHKFTASANATDGVHFEVAMTASSYYRVVYTNGSQTTTSFNLSSALCKYGAGVHMHPANFSFNDNHPVQLGRNLVAGINKQGNSQNVGTTGGALDIHDADVHTILINRHFIDFDSVTENPSVAITAGDTLINVASTTGFSVGDNIVIKDASGDVREHHFQIKVLVVDTSITVDRPIDIDYTTSATLEKISINMNVNGSLASPVIYQLKPPSDEVWHITRIILSIIDNVAMDDSKFGGIAALTNGVAVRENKTTNDTLTIWRDNQAIIEDMFDVVYSDKAPAGSFGLRGRWTFKNAGVVLRLDGSLGDTAEILIQDDLTALTSFTVKGQGHIEA